jgi:hypothetical protein
MYKLSGALRSTHGQDGAIVLDIRHGRMFRVNRVGSRILELLKAGSAEAAIVDQLSVEFDVRRDVAAGDVREFLEELKEHRLLEEVDFETQKNGTEQKS